MADSKISALTAKSGLAAGTEEMEINEGGTSKKMALADLLAYMGDGVQSGSVADQTINAATTALLIGSTLVVPTGKMRIGTIFRWRIVLSKTGAGTAANTFIVQFGTAGTTADADVLTFSLPVGTAVVDAGMIDIEVTIRGPLSGSCIAQGHLRMTHNLQITGLATIPCVDVSVTSGVFDATVASLIASVVCTTAASTVLTFQQVSSEAKNL